MIKSKYMTDTQSENLKLEILRRILRELSEIKGFLENLSKIPLKESKRSEKEAREHRKKMLLEAKKLLETPNREAMILEELKKRGHYT